MAGARAYLARLAVLAPKYGFGFVHSKRELVEAMPAQNAAAYLSSYFVKGWRGTTALWESVQSSAMPRSIIYVSTGLTTQTGCTMRTLRLKRALFVLWSVSVEETNYERSATCFRCRGLCRDGMKTVVLHVTRAETGEHRSLVAW